MQLRWLVGVGLSLAPVAAVGCGLARTGLGADLADDAGGRADASGAPPTAPDAEATADGGGPPLAEDASRPPADSAAADASAAAPPACTDAIPPGWAVALLAPGRAPCPAGSLASHDAVAGADAGVGACTCGCTLAGPVTCETGTLALALGASPVTCATAGLQAAIQGELCAALPKALAMPAAMAVAPLPATGTCSATASTDPTQIRREEVRFCDLGGAMAESACNGTVPSGFAACLAQPGARACPPGRFVRRRVLSDDVSLTCTACGCTVTGTCRGATAAFFSDTGCNNGIIALSADGQCGPTDVQGTVAASVLYNATPSDVGTCIPSSASAVLSPSGDVTTLCCQ